MKNHLLDKKKGIKIVRKKRKVKHIMNKNMNCAERLLIFILINLNAKITREHKTAK